MPFQIQTQHIDLASGMHVIELGDAQGHKHIVQIAIGHDACPACGAVHQKDLEGIIPQAAVAQVVESLNASHANMHEYAKKHGIPIK